MQGLPLSILPPCGRGGMEVRGGHGVRVVGPTPCARRSAGKRHTVESGGSRMPGQWAHVLTHRPTPEGGRCALRTLSFNHRVPSATSLADAYAATRPVLPGCALPGRRVLRRRRQQGHNGRARASRRPCGSQSPSSSPALQLLVVQREAFLTRHSLEEEQAARLANAFHTASLFPGAMLRIVDQHGHFSILNKVCKETSDYSSGAPCPGSGD